ncbi:MAG TPA: DUF695 domain-containing protein [Gemmatales bacterium]|nr:DUF695 domain-containing protein [Gemmatales bacterium]
MDEFDSWAAGTGEVDGKLLIFRFRVQPPADADQATFPHLMAVSWEYESPNDSGMPAEEVAERMVELEELLVEALENSWAAFLFVVTTCDGVRDWQWYAKDPDEVMRLVNVALGELEPFPIDFGFMDDPEWAEYARFQALEGAPDEDEDEEDEEDE